MMDAVILAAGEGRRLHAASQGLPKCLVEVGGRTLMDHHVAALRAAGVGRIVVVGGHRADDVRAAVPDATFVVNEDYATTNSLYSLHLARSVLKGSFLVVNADVFADPEVYARVAGGPGSCLAYDATSGHDEEHMKVRLLDGFVRGLSKSMPSWMVSGENVGILRVDERDRVAYFDGARSVLERPGGASAWAPAAMDVLCLRRHVRALDVSDLAWVEIDFPEDLEVARNRVWPSIRPASLLQTA